MTNTAPTDRYDCACHGNVCRCTDRPAPAARPDLGLALDGPITASAGDIHQMLTRSAFAGPLLDVYDRALRRAPLDRGLVAHQAACLRQLARQRLDGQRVAQLDTSLTPAPLTASQALAAITTDPASAAPLRAYNAAMRTGNVVAAAQLAKVLRYRARTVHDDVVAHEQADAMHALRERVERATGTSGPLAPQVQLSDEPPPEPAPRPHRLPWQRPSARANRTTPKGKAQA